MQNTAYIAHMQTLARQSYREIFDNVHEVVFVDFPDHPNVGDSAIALGQLAFFDYASITTLSAYCIATLDEAVYRSETPVVINGGGNIAGFFDGIDEHRNKIAERLNDQTLLIQAPQSVHFVSTGARERFRDRFASRRNLRMSVRDHTAASALTGIIDHAIIAPDAVHHLGFLPSDAPYQRYVVVARTDREAGGSAAPCGSVDWKKDHPPLAIASSLRWKAPRLGRFRKLFNLQVDQWRRVANSRLDRGIEILSQGEVIVTDRLHAMLIGLQLGRPVIAIDNNNQKLTKYADTWFGHTQPNIRFAKSFEEAIKLVN